MWHLIVSSVEDVTKNVPAGVVTFLGEDSTLSKLTPKQIIFIIILLKLKCM